MKTAKFTPGPWEVMNGSVYANTSAKAFRIAFMDRIEEKTSPTERDANAHLIAQAPRMYEALKQVLQAHEQSKLMPLHFDAVRRVLSAIDKGE